MKNLISRLMSSDVSEVISATFDIDNDNIRRCPVIVTLMRDNLHAKCDDLLEITIMRLGLRAVDPMSLDRIIEIAETSQNSLVISASIYAVSSIAEHFPHSIFKVIELLELLSREIQEEEIASLAKSELQKLRGII